MQTDLEKFLDDAMDDPSRVYEAPKDVTTDRRLARQQKLSILERWEADARELAVAEEENMSGGERNRLAEVLNAKRLLTASEGEQRSSPSKA